MTQDQFLLAKVLGKTIQITDLILQVRKVRVGIAQGVSTAWDWDLDLLALNPMLSLPTKNQYLHGVERGGLNDSNK